MAGKVSKKSTKVAIKAAARRVAAKPPNRGKPTMTLPKMAKLIREGKVPAHYAVAKSEGNGAVQAWDGLGSVLQDGTFGLPSLVCRSVN